VILAVLGLRCSFLALGFSLAFLRRDLGIFSGSFYFRSWLLLTGLGFTGGLLSRIRVFCVIVLLIAATNQRADLTLVTVDRSRIDTQVLGSLGIWIDMGVRVLHLLLSALSDQVLVIANDKALEVVKHNLELSNDFTSSMTVLSSVVAQVQRIQNYKIRLQSCQLIK
jgi:hypothetical protein